ncbi:MAG TPA: folate-binding protein YgfZ, partial [Microbacterium sp.]|nr:folate-binding protein YgfZ [Microbacterium sp.]
SVALHVDDGPIGLALVRRTTPDGDATVQTAEGAVAARLETIVPPEAGAAASVPRLPRLSRRAAASPPSP